MNLRVDKIDTFYGSSQALFQLSLEVQSGSVTTLLGRNGMGKTTTIRSIMGLQQTRAGHIQFQGERLERLPAHKIARLGLGLVPEGRQIFPNLTVEENLIATRRGTTWKLNRIYDLFPGLLNRKKNMGSQLSGGEQQMLAIGRALLTNPKLLILDEATEGLAPLLRKAIWDSIRKLKAEGQAILVVDSNLKELVSTADRVYILEKGKIVWQGQSSELSEKIREQFLSV